MRLAPVLAFAALFASAPASAQESRPPMRRMPPSIRIATMDQLRENSELLARKLEVDAFVSTRLAAAVADLNDFQTSAALAKARGRILEAELRVSQTREADPRIGQILDKSREILDRAERGSAAMGLSDVQKELLRESGRLQRVLYDDLDAATRVRKSISDMERSLNLMSEALDNALEQALSAMFTYLRSGGE
ncbi:MAG TPA: hypothetical protein VGE86_09895 [Thermoanaerobaculia bacterium]